MHVAAARERGGPGLRHGMSPRLKIALVSGLSSLALVGAIYHQFSTTLSAEITDFARRSQHHAWMINESTNAALDIVEGLRTAAQSNLANPNSLSSSYFGLLGQVPGKDGFGLIGLGPPADPQNSLNLTGLGTFRPDESRRVEIDAALSLDPVFRWVKDIYPDTPWVYYLSINRFMCVYPYIPFDAFFMDDSFYEMDLFERGRPTNNPERRPYITDTYLDEAGKGLMVTVGSPVYRHDQFMGIVGFDLTLSALSESLRTRQFLGDELYLVNDRGEVIAIASEGRYGDTLKQKTSLHELSPGLFEAAQRQQGQTMPTRFENSRVYASNLPGSSWMLISKRSNWHLYRSAAQATLPLLAFMMVMLSGMIVFLKEKQHQKEIESKKSLTLFRSLLDSSMDMIAVVEPSSGRFLDANRTMCDFVGMTLEELRKKHVFDVSGTIGSHEAWNSFVDGIADNGRLSMGELINRSDGSSCEAELNAHYAREDDHKYIVAILRDISERKRAEAEKERLQRRIEQTHRMEAIGQLAGGVAHDFNNILVSIMGFSELARDRAGEDNKQRDYLDQILKSSERARRLVRQLLSYGRGDSNNTAEIMLLASQVSEVASMLEPMLSSNIEIRLDLPDPSPMIRMDPIHLQQLLMNLCINARDAMTNGGVLEIAVSERVFEQHECRLCHEKVDGDWVCISVRDSGVGIAPDMLDKVFQAFFTTKDAGQGSGMGLTVVQGIVSTYGGHVLVDSVVDAGTCFEILLPPFRRARAVDAAQVGPVSPFDLGGKRILVIDDEPIVRLYFQEVLSLANAQVTTFAGGAEALQAFARSSDAFSLVITDQTMPGISGVEIARAIRASGSDVPIFIYSGYTDAVSAQEIAELRIADVLLKPVTADELATAINHAFSQH